ncbi:MAG: response regulator transcription factor [Burkholderiales bacterium]|nr:response regulator transcription factor [Burkholderiales bacterium]
MRVLVADDHPLVRDALARAVRGLRSRDGEAGDVQVCEAGDLAAALAGLAQPVDLALVDLQMPGMDGLGGLAALRAALASQPLVVTSGLDDAATIRAVLAAGAAGFIPKTAGAELLLQALRLVLGGGVYVPAEALSGLAPTTPPASPPAGLTPRQAEVLQALARGEPNKQIARELGLSEGTVKLHLAAILRVLQARNRTEAVVRARALGWLD